MKQEAVSVLTTGQGAPGRRGRLRPRPECRTTKTVTLCAHAHGVTPPANTSQKRSSAGFPFIEKPCLPAEDRGENGTIKLGTIGPHIHDRGRGPISPKGPAQFVDESRLKNRVFVPRNGAPAAGGGRDPCGRRFLKVMGSGQKPRSCVTMVSRSTRRFVPLVELTAVKPTQWFPVHGEVRHRRNRMINQ